MISGLKHAVGWLKENEGYNPDVVVLLKATLPSDVGPHSVASTPA